MEDVNLTSVVCVCVSFAEALVRISAEDIIIYLTVHNHQKNTFLLDSRLQLGSAHGAHAMC